LTRSVAKRMFELQGGQFREMLVGGDPLELIYDLRRGIAD